MAGWASGFQAGAQLGRSLIDTYQQAREQRLIQEAQGLKPVEVPGAQYSPEEQAREVAIAQQQGMQGAQALGLTPEEAPEFVARMPVQAPTQAPSRWQLGEQTMYRAPTEQEVTRARNEAIARAIELRNPMAAAEMRRGLAREAREEETYQYGVGRRPVAEQREALGLRRDIATTTAQESAVQKEADLRTGLQEIAALPEDQRQEATVALYARIMGAPAAEQLRGQYGANATSAIALRAAKFEEGVSDAMRKGTLMQYVDEMYTDATFERKGNTVYINDPAGRRVFAKGSDDEINRAFLAYANPKSFMTYAQQNWERAQAVERAAREDRRLDIAERRIGIAEARAAAADKQLSPATVAELNDLSAKITDAEEKGDRKLADQLSSQFNRKYILAATEIGKVIAPQRQQPTGLSFKDASAAAKEMVDNREIRRAPDGQPILDAQGREQRHTMETAIAEVQARFGGGAPGAGAQGMPGWGQRGAATRPGPAATPARPVDLSPVGSVNVAPSAAPTAPATGLNTLVSRTATGVNVRTPDGNVQFMPFSALPVSELVRLGVYTTTR